MEDLIASGLFLLIMTQELFLNLKIKKLYCFMQLANIMSMNNTYLNFL